MNDLIIIGGGAAGMMSGIIAGRRNLKTVLLEKNEKLGKKLFITGKGRCNLTNSASDNDFFDNICTNKKFFYSAFYSFTNQDAISFFEEIGLKTKEERGGRIFPESDKSSDVIKFLEKELKKADVDVQLNTEVLSLKKNNDGVFEVKTNKGIFTSNKVIIATGGKSYPVTGSKGDGYKFAESFGHTVTPLYRSLVGIETFENVKNLEGISLKNINVTITDGKKKVFSEFGEMLFTAHGVSGPVILSASSLLAKELGNKELNLHIDYKPAIPLQEFENKILKLFTENPNKKVLNALESILPSRLLNSCLEHSMVDKEKTVNSITVEERKNIVNAFKDYKLSLKEACDWNQAIITKGGVNVKEINPSTLESKIEEGLYFIGEVVDLDAFTGGFNLQIAWSMAYCCASNL
ncbi:MAG: NAD(P)/FAD-dependent oxidoreductase [Lachnospiraceae bacterium]|nr:NAD(P)/FAD-dependent oxidoreductase [Lachnospiraceae bacterium]